MAGYAQRSRIETSESAGQELVADAAISPLRKKQIRKDGLVAEYPVTQD
jgi:hypothetical protein